MRRERLIEMPASFVAEAADDADRRARREVDELQRRHPSGRQADRASRHRHPRELAWNHAGFFANV